MISSGKLMGECIENLSGSTGTKEGNDPTVQSDRHIIRYSDKSFDSVVLPPV